MTTLIEPPQTYQPGDWVIYQGPKLRLSGWLFKVTAVHGDVLHLKEDVWGIGLRAHVQHVFPE